MLLPFLPRNGAYGQRELDAIFSFRADEIACNRRSDGHTRSRTSIHMEQLDRYADKGGTHEQASIRRTSW